MKISDMTKKEIVKRSLWKCKHKHTGLVHPKCYERQDGFSERVGFLDIEATNLNANFGMTLCYCIKSLDGEIISNTVTPKEVKSHSFDKRLMGDCIEDMRRFDRLVTWYGSGFDMPFLRARAMYHGLDFPEREEVIHNDAYMMGRGKLKIHSKRLQVVAEFLGIEAKGHPLNYTVWMAAMTGDKKALDYILTHCKEDVVTTEEVWKRLTPYLRITRTSI